MKDEGKGKRGDFSSAIHYPDLSGSVGPVSKRTHVMGLCISTTKKIDKKIRQAFGLTDSFEK